jgi:hypothetical protein
MVLMLLLAAAPLHSRLVTDNGPVHVAIPPQARVTVVYVHGFWTQVDEAWVQHRLGSQLGGAQAAVIAPEAPSGPGQQVRWPDLAALLAEVEARTGATLPEDVIAIGHSGAYRTIAGWVNEPRLKHVALLDAFYGGSQPWDRFLAADPSRRMHVIARATAKQSRPFCARTVRATCEPAGFSHMGIVTSGQVIPGVLRDAILMLGGQT